MSLKRISLQEIDWGDEAFRSSLGREVEPLTSSIEKVGLIVPPRVQPGPGGYRIVSGFLRLEALRGLGREGCMAEVLPEGRARRELLLEALHENLHARGFHWTERCRVIERVLRQWREPEEWAVGHLLPAMGIAPSREVLKRHLWAAALGRPLLEALKERGCSLSNALRLLKWPAGDRHMAVWLMDRLHMNENLLREVLGLVREAAVREGISPGLVLEDDGLKEILGDEEAGRSLRTAAFRKRLREIRYPMLSSMEREFQEAKRALRLPGQIAIHAHPFFEEPGVRVTFQARSPEDLLSTCRELLGLAGKRDALERLFLSTQRPPEEPGE